MPTSSNDPAAPHRIRIHSPNPAGLSGARREISITVTAVFHPLEGCKQQLSDALATCIPAVHSEQGCQLYATHDAEDETITMIEK